MGSIIVIVFEGLYMVNSVASTEPSQVKTADTKGFSSNLRSKVVDVTSKLYGCFTQNVQSTDPSLSSFQVNKSTLAKLHEGRNEVGLEKQKKYTGIDRVNQVLRHLSSAVYEEAQSQNIELKEIQCSVFGDKVHISSNFESGKIHDLIRSLLGKSKRPDYHHASSDNWKDMIENKHARHIHKLTDFCEKTGTEFETYINKVDGEICSEFSEGKEYHGLENEVVKSQVKDMLNTLRSALQKAKDNDLSLIEIHAPLVGGTRRNDTDVQVTTHAELNIEAYIARNADTFKNKSGRLIIPMAGRYIPCVTCHEVESTAKISKGGVFGPEGLFILHRSTERVGFAYSGENQHLPPEIIHPDSATAKSIVEVVAGNLNGGIATHSAGQDKPGQIGTPEHGYTTVYDTDSEAGSVAGYTPVYDTDSEAGSVADDSSLDDSVTSSSWLRSLYDSLQNTFRS
jgi:hypothetical protein